MVTIRIDIEKLDSWAEVIHELTQSPRGYGPVMRSILAAKLGVSWQSHLERQAMGRSEAIPKNYTGNEAALDSFAVLHDDIASIN